MKGLFITGTDTGVGKTVVSGIIISLLKPTGLSVGAIKPFETGREMIFLYHQMVFFSRMFPIWMNL